MELDLLAVDAVPTKLLALLDINRHPHPPQPYHYYKLFIQCEIIDGHARNGLETKGVHFYHEDNLPNLSLGRNTDAQIKILFEFLRNPHKDTIFD